VPLSRRSPADHALVKFSPSLSSEDECRSTRLGILSSLFDTTERGASLRIASAKDDAAAAAFHDQVDEVFQTMVRIQRLMKPLSLVAERDTFYFDILQLYLFTCRLLIDHHAIWEARVADLTASSNPQWGSPAWHDHFKPRGRKVVPLWARDTLVMAESILIVTLQANVDLLGTAPDTIFTMITLGAGVLVGTKFLIEQAGADLEGTSDKLLAKVIGHLAHASNTPGDPVQRCEFMVRGLVNIWERRNIPRDESSIYPTPSSEQHIPPECVDMVLQEPSNLPNVNFDFDSFFNSTLGNSTLGNLDTDFWASLIPSPQQ